MCELAVSGFHFIFFKIIFLLLFCDMFTFISLKTPFILYSVYYIIFCSSLSQVQVQVQVLVRM